MSYRIIYWPGFTGRAEPAILLLEDVSADYVIDTNVREVLADLARTRPVFACPVLIDGEMVISQTSIITQYLGRKHGLDVGPEHAFAASQLAYNIADIWSETYEGRRNEDQEYIDDRFPRWISVLENSFQSPDTTYFFSDDEPTYVDYLALNIATLADYCWGHEAMRTIAAAPRLNGWLQHMRERPRIKAYLDNPDSLKVAYEAVRAV